MTLRGAVALLPLLLVGAACGNDTDEAPGGTAPLSPEATTTTVTSTSAPPTTSPAPTASLDEVSVRLREVARVEAPTALAPRAGTADLYVAEQGGAVRRLERSGDAFVVAEGAVVDLSDDTEAGGERGLLGLTFSPDGAQLFVNYTDSNDDGASVVARFTMDGDVADAASRIEILRLPQPYPNHNGGNLVFGPDGFLWIGFGDGGSGDDPDDNAQDRTVLLGKMLRIDVSASTAAEPYTVPRDNPFVDEAGARREIWASGLRNPWRYSFDRATGDLWIADVGQNAWEEIDVLPASNDTGRGANLGWPLREGTHDTDKPGPRDGLVEPIFEYSHDDGVSVTGGFVYRGTAIPQLVGTYLFTDFAAPTLRGITMADGELDQQATIETAGEPMVSVSSFGEDADGEIYVLSLTGQVLRIEPG